MYSIHHPNADSIAREYIGALLPLKVLGWGIEGVVFGLPNDMTAIKIHSRLECYERELAVYKRLFLRKVHEVEGFSVPRLQRYHSGLGVIQMSIVKKPFLVDFSSATLDRPNDSVETAEEWWARIEERFGERTPIVQSVYYSLINQYQIYYGDFKPGNIEF